MTQPLVSSHFPYLPLHLDVGARAFDVEALLDTGFDGDVAMPPSHLTGGGVPSGYMTCRLADGTSLSLPVYRATVKVGALGPFRVYVVALGDEMLVGRGVSDRLRVTLDHGQSLTIEP
ncbi:MAG TPA: hypothetical protein VII06_23620 [Chloroflexota bacterium]|jgi:predicted aspartyl protease